MKFFLEIDDCARRKVCRDCGEASAYVPIRASSAYAEDSQQAVLDDFSFNHFC